MQEVKAERANGMGFPSLELGRAMMTDETDKKGKKGSSARSGWKVCVTELSNVGAGDTLTPRFRHRHVADDMEQ
ncbi:hypothetical protein ColTof3_04207 [Colletotrichum tofieldiae]|nr:hypothetical protein ColTof3_04207 [Colletotrichum tofieldiae]